MKQYDVVIAGASFAGLAVANQLRGYRVLLLDRKPIGSGQTSACGTILQVLKYWDLTDTVLQTHDSLTLHTVRRSIEFPSPYPWCTFDYRRLCQKLFERSGADFVQAAVQGTDSENVYTNRGRFAARCLVDATGWWASLASSLRLDFSREKPMNFGIETIQPFTREELATKSSLHFWYDSSILPNGVGWVFPRGETTSVGVGSHRGAAHLRDPLISFAERFDIRPDGFHGTYFPNALRAPTVGKVFVVGDAAGMCIGLTSEGIRPAMFFGEACGRIIRRVLEGKLSLETGLNEYEGFVEARRIFFTVFTALQSFLTRLPSSWIDWIALIIQHERVRPWVLDKYWALTRDWETVEKEA
jgi:flavin-dependent dehydrogenase